MKPWYLNGFIVTIIVIIGSSLIDFLILTVSPSAKSNAIAILAVEAVIWGIIMAILLSESRKYDEEQKNKKFIANIKSNYDQKK